MVELVLLVAQGGTPNKWLVSWIKNFPTTKTHDVHKRYVLGCPPSQKIVANEGL